MVCPKCGAQIDDDSIICPICGDETYSNEESEDVQTLAKSEDHFAGTPSNRNNSEKSTPKIWYLIWAVILIFLGYKFLGKSTSDISTENTETTSYQIIISEIQKEIDQLKDSENPDMDTIKTDYGLLLQFRIDEYMFKRMAYEHFTGKRNEKKCKDVEKAIESIQKEMKSFYEDDEIETLTSTYSGISYHSYSRFNYNDERFEHTYPYIDDMWIEYIDEAVKSRMEQS